MEWAREPHSETGKILNLMEKINTNTGPRENIGKAREVMDMPLAR